jgi:hypothetical protein
MHMRKRLSGVVLLAGLLAVSGHEGLMAGKPAPPPAPWSCSVTMRDADGDVIRSDGKGAYLNGQGGVSCTITADPAALKYGWLYLYFPSPKRATRSFVYLGQAGWQPGDPNLVGGPGYTGFTSRGSFEVKGLTRIAWNGDSAYYDIEPFRANVEIGQFNGDSNVTGSSEGGSSVFVRPMDAKGCTWSFWSDPDAPAFVSPTGLGDSAGTRYGPRVIQHRAMAGTNWVTQGFYPMAFGATVRITGGKTGCP